MDNSDNSVYEDKARPSEGWPATYELVCERSHPFEPRLQQYELMAVSWLDGECAWCWLAPAMLWKKVGTWRQMT